MRWKYKNMKLSGLKKLFYKNIWIIGWFESNRKRRGYGQNRSWNESHRKTMEIRATN